MIRHSYYFSQHFTFYGPIRYERGLIWVVVRDLNVLSIVGAHSGPPPGPEKKNLLVKSLKKKLKEKKGLSDDTYVK